MDTISPQLIKQLESSKWSARNSALKKIGATRSSEAKGLVMALLKDRRRSSLWKQCLGEPFHQVGFTRRNAWMALNNQDLTMKELAGILPLGLDDPYYEVRSACWNTLGKYLQCGPKNGDHLTEFTPTSLEVAKLKNRIYTENNFEIMIAMMSAADLLMNSEELLSLGHQVHQFKHWRVRAAYLDCLGRVVQLGRLTREHVEHELQSFNLRSEYFRPVFMLKEKGAELEKALIEAASREEHEALSETVP